MAVPFDAGDTADAALGLLSAAGDAFAGRRLGFGLRRAALAARFARHRGGAESAIAASWLAGALAETGRVAVVVRPGTSDRLRLLAEADAPLYGARLVAALPGMPRAAADLVRWHREHEDGTGFPDRLRWDGIPADAVALGIAHAFLELVDDPQEPRHPGEALYEIVAESGRRFRVGLVRAFREFVLTAPDAFEPLAADLPALDPGALLADLAGRIDARDERLAGRSERLAAIAGPLAARLGLDPAPVARLARLVALGRAAADLPPHDDGFDPLSRFGREPRQAEAKRAAAIAAAVPAYAADAPLLAQSAVWYEESPPERPAAVVALALAADALDPVEGPRRLAAAAGTQFDPAVVQAYLVSLGAAT
ncbi:MAG: hypothetical protein QOI11_2051 [Candidatus Eremiobacteraeota bacterium]|jgi:hypothetical protein|nr:hypothetical protein [Candidatus Eremiobacteraeota bacterium]